MFKVHVYSRPKKYVYFFVEFVETLLLDIVYHEPNDETIAAIEETRSGKKLETFNSSELEKLIDSL